MSDVIYKYSQNEYGIDGLNSSKYIEKNVYQFEILVTVRVRNSPTIIATLVLDEKLQVSKSLSVRRNIVNPRVVGW